MPEGLNVYDYILFQRINKDWATPFGDQFFPIITDLNHNKLFLYIALPLIIIWWLRRETVRGLRALIGLILVVAATDIVSAQFLKPHFHRLRPIESGMEPNIRSLLNSGFSFPSNHAANMFAAACFLSMYYPSSTWWFGLIAFMVSYSRVYVGAHFPLDVIGGAMIGTMMLDKLVKPFNDP